MALTAAETLVLDDLLDGIEDRILDRGMELFDSGHVEFLGKNSARMLYEFNVKGSGRKAYDVDICLHQDFTNYGKEFNLNIGTRCACIYFEQNITCKHVAAASLFLNCNIDENFMNLTNKLRLISPKAKSNSPTKRAYFPIEFSCTENDLADIAEKLPIISTQEKPREIQKIEFLESSLRYFIEIIDYSIHVTLTFDPINEKVTITCSDKNTILQAQAVDFLQQRWSHPKNQDLLLITDTQRLLIKKQQLQDLGLLAEINYPEKAFELRYDNGAIRFFYSGELEGMMDMVALGNEFKDYSTIEMAALDFEALADQSDAKEFGLYNAGFALAISDQGALYNIFAFIAKGKKNDPEGFHVRFDLLSDPDDLRLAKNDNLERFLIDIKLMKSYVERNKKEALHRSFIKFIQSIGNHYPIFRSSAIHGGYYYDKFHKNSIKEQLTFQYAELEFTLCRNKSIFELQAWILIGEERLNLAEMKGKLLLSDVFGFWNDRVILIFENVNKIALLKYWKDRVPSRFVENKFLEFVEHVIVPLAQHAKFSDETGMISEIDSGAASDRELYISELSGLVIFEPKVRYSPDITSNPLSTATLFDAESTTIFLRNSDVENEFVEFLKSLHPSFSQEGGGGYFFLKHNQFTEGKWFLETFELLKVAGIKVFGLDKLTLKRYSPFPPVISMNVNSNSDWFEINTQLKFGDYSVRLKDIKQAIKADERYVRLGDGSLGQIPDKWLRKFRKLIQSSEAEDETLKLSKIHFNLLDDFQEELINPEVERELAEKKARLQSFEEIREVEVPKAVRADLRNYQKAGLNWMNFLQDYGWGGILADDMGLGKTLQVITLISQMAEKGAIRVLIVAPTTLLFNWKNELDKFAPHLDYFIHHGDRYDNAEDLKAHSLVLTSYGLVINDLDLLCKLEFDLIVADESQAIKNVSSLRYKSIIKLRGKLKIAMTGTPIENGIAELFAHMNFVNPGFFRTFSNFKDQYLKELRNGNPEIMEDLRKKIQPFVLRRTKEEVLTELPDKIEEYLYCEMGVAQKKVYEAYRNEYREFIQGKFNEEGANQSKMYVLEGLTKLRQICDSPDLISKEKKGAKSAKIDLLMEHIEEKTGNHKILIFSQFVKMLDLVKKEMVSRNIPFSYLDGKSSMKNRENSVNQFQEDTSIRVFLISLKAGGTGLNLTAADYVYILDPWWNPAVENQAIDRCYRMGQEKKVMAYRMICKDTVEEKIVDLQKSKLKLAKEVISEGDGFLTGMNGETMLSLFE
jgi:superfamily II DNA or RNA helicase